MKRFCLLLLLLTTCLICFGNSADINQTINDQLSKIDFSSLEDYFGQISNGQSFDFYSIISNVINGNGGVAGEDVLHYLLSLISNDVKTMLPSLFTIVAICILCLILNGIKSSFIEESVTETIKFVCFLTVFYILVVQLTSLITKTQNIIRNITKTAEIMSPIMITLMIACGGNVSAELFKPSVLFLTTTVSNIFLNIILPLIVIFGVFSALNKYSGNVKLEKSAVFIASIIKWILGLVVLFYGLFVSLKGIISSNIDVISFKIAKFTISNSVPIVGGLIKDGFDVIVAGSAIIKNAVGLVGVGVLIYIILAPIVHLIVYSLVLKLISAIIEPLGNDNVSSLLHTSSKVVTYLIICILICSLLFFITILQAVLSANAFF